MLSLAIALSFSTDIYIPAYKMHLGWIVVLHNTELLQFLEDQETGRLAKISHQFWKVLRFKVRAIRERVRAAATARLNSILEYLSTPR